MLGRNWLKQSVVGSALVSFGVFAPGLDGASGKIPPYSSQSVGD